MAMLERPRVEYRTPEDLVQEVSRGIVRIPQFQRGFRWEATDIVKLFDSILRGFPIGNLLLWRRPAQAQTLHVGPLAVEAPASATALWVVDGQQRITSLVGALTQGHQATDNRFRVHLDLDSGEFHTTGPRQSTPQAWVPVSFLLDTATLLRWMRENSGWLTDDQLALADQAAKALREYQIPTYIVVSAQQEPLLEIFTRMNTTGKRLTKAEVFQALNAGVAGDSPVDLRSTGQVSAELGFGALDDRLALRCVLAFRGGDVFREDFGQEFSSPDDQERTFREVAAALRDVVAFLTATAGIPHIKLLPYSYVMPVLTRFVRLHGAPEGRTATLLRRWMWRGAVDSTLAGGVSVPDVRGQIAAVDADSAGKAAGALLARIRSTSAFFPQLDKLHFSHGMAKLNVLGLLAAGPLDPATGLPVDITRLLSDGTPLRTIIRSDAPGADTIANRIIVPAGYGNTLPTLLTSASAEVAASHLIDLESQHLLGADQIPAFFERRAESARRQIQRHIDDMAEWGARDGRSTVETMRSAA